MDITCESCGTSYRVPDSKVEGRVSQIECRECGNVIVVRGDAPRQTVQTPEDDEKLEYAAQWYAVVEGAQVGPVTSEEIEDRFFGGQLTPESFVWRDGFPDWVRLREVSEFAHLAEDRLGPEDETVVTGGTDRQDEATVVLPPEDFYLEAKQEGDKTEVGGVDEEARTKQETVPKDLLNSLEDDTVDEIGEDPEGTPEPKPADEPTESVFWAEPTEEMVEDEVRAEADTYDEPKQHDEPDTKDETRPTPQSHERENGSSAARGPDEDTSPIKTANDLVGQRNEDSVLFSLDTLDEIQTIETKDEAGEEAEEGSGLIDLESLTDAQRSVEGEGTGNKDRSGPFIGGDVGIPDVGAKQQDSSNRLLFIGVLVVSVIALALLGVISYLLWTGRGKPETVTVVKQAEGSKQPKAGAEQSGEGGSGTNTGAKAKASDNVTGDDKKADNTSKDKPKKDKDNSEASPKDKERKKVAAATETPPSGRNRPAGEAGGAAGGESEGSNTQGDNPSSGSATGNNTGQKPAGTRTQNQRNRDRDRNDPASNDQNNSDRTASGSSQSDRAGSSRRSGSSPSRDRERESPSKESTGSSGAGDRSKDDGDMDSILNQIDEGKKGDEKQKDKKSGGPARDENESQRDLPDKLTKSMVSSTIKKYKSKVDRCAENSNRKNMSGIVFVGMSIEKSGRVSDTSIKTSRFRGTDVGECVEGVVQDMQFPESKSSLEVAKYPFRIK